MKQILEFLPIVLFFGAYQMSGETLTVGAWSHTFDGIFSATAVLMIATIGVWLVMLAITQRNDKRLMWMMVAVGMNVKMALMPAKSQGVEFLTWANLQ